jgi:hypothetical protein
MGIPITWYALAANTEDPPPHNAQFNYTSTEAPVEADEYERMRQRAETAEARINELELAYSQLDMLVSMMDAQLPKPAPGTTYSQWFRQRLEAQGLI